MKKFNRSEIEAVGREIKKQLDEASAVVLIGSVARNCATERSDTDLLLIGELKPAVHTWLAKFEFHNFSKSDFVGSLRNGDDFPNWCIRYGIPLAGGQYWDHLQNHIGQKARWPEWRRKIAVAGKRWIATLLFLESGDPDAAGESALFAYDHLIRGLLLREGIFPLSRPELVKQIKPLSPELGSSLGLLLKQRFDRIPFARILEPLSTALDFLDTDSHQMRLEQLKKLSTQKARIHTMADLAEQ